MRNYLIVGAVLVLLGTASAFGQKYAPLPPKLLAAEKVCIDQSLVGDRRDRVYRALSKPKQFEIVEDCEDAQLAFHFRDFEEEAGPTVIAVPPPTLKGWPVVVGQVRNGQTCLLVYDPHAEDPKNPSHALTVWQNCKRWSASGAAHDLAKDLQKRLKEGRKTSP
jgi:hypothetical protein